eukprot:scaffold1031_cov461-Prasinococcus_capsulatus_cf.AAC.15
MGSDARSKASVKAEDNSNAKGASTCPLARPRRGFAARGRLGPQRDVRRHPTGAEPHRALPAALHEQGRSHAHPAVPGQDRALLHQPGAGAPRPLLRPLPPAAVGVVVTDAARPEVTPRARAWRGGAQVWLKLEEQNQEFFKAYYTRLQVKDQIILFNHLLEQHVQLIQRMGGGGGGANNNNNSTANNGAANANGGFNGKQQMSGMPSMPPGHLGAQGQMMPGPYAAVLAPRAAAAAAAVGRALKVEGWRVTLLVAARQGCKAPCRWAPMARCRA